MHKILIYLYIIHILKSSTCFEHYPAHLQYHWCPTVFSVITGLWISSIRYNNRMDGIAMNTRINAGAIVHSVSIICPSKINRLVCLFWIILIIV
jgi:hypothetical protein